MRNKRNKKKDYHRFTLIELVIVITILAILAAVAIPAFQNLTTQARNSATQGAVGGLRSALAVYRANELANNRAGAYPIIGDMAEGAALNPMEGGDVPDNPWCTQVYAACDPDKVTTGALAARTTTNTGSAGWIYAPANGLIYANTSGNGGATQENSY